LSDFRYPTVGNRTIGYRTVGKKAARKRAAFLFFIF
jgi:hypothetical protein